MSKQKSIKAILKEYCNLMIKYRKTGMGIPDEYTIYYDAMKFGENYSQIIENIKVLGEYRRNSSLRDVIERSPTEFKGFYNTFSVNRLISYLIVDFCLPDIQKSRVYKWKVQNPLEDNIEFNKNCSGKMEKPLAVIFENHLGYCEKYVFDYPEVKELQLLLKLKEIFNRFKLSSEELEKYRVKFRISLVPIEEKEENIYIDRKLDIELLENLLTKSDEEVMKFIYSEGIFKLFK